MPTYMVSVYEIVICRVVVRRTLDPPRIFGAIKVTGKTTGLTPQHLCTTKDLWRLRLLFLALTTTLSTIASYLRYA